MYLLIMAHKLSIHLGAYDSPTAKSTTNHNTKNIHLCNITCDILICVHDKSEIHKRKQKLYS